MADEKYPRRMKMDPAEFKTRGQIEAEHIERENAPVKFGSCCAHGCPLPGSINQGQGFVCASHAFTQFENWSGVTTRLRNMRSLLRHIHHVTVNRYGLDVMSDLERIVCELGFPELAPVGDEIESPSKWIRRARDFVFKEATYPQRPVS